MDHLLPHGYCYLWKPWLVWLHAASDGVIALAYFGISGLLFWFVRRRRDLPYPWMFGLFALFIVACGAGHLADVWTIWRPAFVLNGGIKPLTAVASIGTAILLLPLLPQALRLPTREQLGRLSDEEQYRTLAEAIPHMA